MKRWMGWAGALCALTAVSASAAPASRPEAPPRRAPTPPANWCTGIQVVSQPAGGDGASIPTFSTKEILDVVFQVQLPERTGGRPPTLPASIVVKVFTPNGFLYQEMEAPVRLKPNIMARLRNPNVPRAVTVGPMPVAGTSITQSALFGSWRVVAEPQGATAGCSGAFVLEP